MERDHAKHRYTYPGRRFRRISPMASPSTIIESLDRLEQVGTDTVELPLLWMELVIDGRVMPARLEELRRR